MRIKTHYRLILVDLSRLKELHADPKAIQQIGFVAQLKTSDNAIVDNEFLFILIILEKNERNEIKIFSRKCNSIITDGKLSRSES